MFTGIAGIIEGHAVEGIIQLVIIAAAVFLTVFGAVRRSKSSQSVNGGIITAAVCTIVCDLWWMLYLFGDSGCAYEINPRNIGITALCAAGIFFIGNIFLSAMQRGYLGRIKILTLLGAGLLFILMAAKYLIRRMFNVVILCGPITDRTFYIGCIILVSCLCCICVITSEAERKRSARQRSVVLVSVFSIVILVAACAWHTVFGMENIKYTDVVSPDGSYTVVIAEGEAFEQHMANAYKKKNAFFAEICSSWQYYSNVKPFYENKYSADWTENDVELTFNDGEKIVTEIIVVE